MVHATSNLCNPNMFLKASQASNVRTQPLLSCSKALSELFGPDVGKQALEAQKDVSCQNLSASQIPFSIRFLRSHSRLMSTMLLAFDLILRGYAIRFGPCALSALFQAHPTLACEQLNSLLRDRWQQLSRPVRQSFHYLQTRDAARFLLLAVLYAD